MMNILSGIAAFFALLNSVWEAYQREVKKRDVEKEVQLQAEKAHRKVKADATKVREAVNGADTRSVDDGLSKYYRD